MNIEMHVLYTFSSQSFHFLQMYTQEWNYWIIWQFCFQFYEEPLYCSPQWLLISLHTVSPTIYKGFLFSTKYLLFVVFLTVAILTGVRWYFIVLVSISLMVGSVACLFMCLFGICVSSLGKCLFTSSAQFLIKFCFSDYSIV